MGKLRNNQSGFGVIEVLVILLVVCLIGLVGWYALRSKDTPKTTQQSETTNLSVKTLSFKPVNTSSWLSKTATFDFLEGKLEYKYPADWTVTEVDTSGHPNYANITSADKKACLLVTVSRSESTIDEEIKKTITNWDDSASTFKLVANSNVAFNKSIGKIQKVTTDGVESLVAVGELGKDSQYPTNTVFIELTTCSVNDVDILNAFMKNVSVNKD